MRSLDWDDVRYFLAVQRAGTLTRAGAALQLNPTTVGRRLNQFEEVLSARLFDRTPEGFVLTEAGSRLLPTAERIEREFLALERDVAGEDQSLSGVVHLTATEMLATRFIVPHLTKFHADYPDLELQLSCTNRTVNLARREADVSLRLSRPREENLVIRRLARIEMGLYGARGYLERVGEPADPERSLAGMQLILFADTRAFGLENAWFAPRLEGACVVMRSDSVSSIYSATVNGAGLALLPRSVADRDTRLTRLRTASAPEPREIWQSVHRDLQHSARVRAVLKFLEEIVLEPGLERARAS